MSIMQDPFYVAKEEIQQSVQGITSLYERWKLLLETTNTSTNDEFKWTQNELKTGLRSLESDILDLDEAIGIVESNQLKFQLPSAELEKRKKFIIDLKKNIQLIKDELVSTKTKAKLDKDSRELLMQQKNTSSGRDKLQEIIVADNQQFIEGQMQKQEIIKQDQDKKIEIIRDNVVILKEMGKNINVALEEQDQIIENMDTEITKADSGLKNSIKKLSALVDKIKDRTQWGIIVLLIVILVGLLVAVFYV